MTIASMPRMMFWVVLVIFSAKDTSSSIQNPTGSCEGADSVPSTHWFSPATDNVYLKDCSLDFLTKEYWMVFAHTDDPNSKAYIMPRPDGQGLRAGFCSDDSEDRELFEKYQLCQESVSDVTLVNNIDPLDALTIAHLLHEQLVFHGTNYGNSETPYYQVEPFAYSDDTLAACNLLTTIEKDHAAVGYCETHKERCNENGECLDIGIIPSRTDIEALVPALNRLYGIGEIPDVFNSQSHSHLDDSATRGRHLLLIRATFWALLAYNLAESAFLA